MGPHFGDGDAIVRRVVETSLRSFLRQLGANLDRAS
jgi:hypothetical protein